MKSEVHDFFFLRKKKRRMGNIESRDLEEVSSQIVRAGIFIACPPLSSGLDFLDMQRHAKRFRQSTGDENEIVVEAEQQDRRVGNETNEGTVEILRAESEASSATAVPSCQVKPISEAVSPIAENFVEEVRKADDGATIDEKKKSCATLSTEVVPLLSFLCGLPRGLQLVRYGGGDDFRSAFNLLHLCVLSDQPSSGSRSLEQRRIIACAISALNAVAPEQDFMGLPNCETIQWERCTFEAALLVSTAVSSSGSEESWTNLFHQGFLHEYAAESGCSAAQKWPLIGVFDANGCVRPFRSFPETEESGVECAPFDALGPADQHIHTVDPFAGGTEEMFVNLLVENGMSHEDAVVFAQVEKTAAGDYHCGADMARVLISSSSGLGSGWVVCMDVADTHVPRVLVTYLIVANNKRDQEAVSKLVDTFQSRSPLEHVLEKLKTAIPMLNLDGVQDRFLDILS